jgi:hypothetical protein
MCLLFAEKKPFLWTIYGLIKGKKMIDNSLFLIFISWLCHISLRKLTEFWKFAAFFFYLIRWAATNFLLFNFISLFTLERDSFNKLVFFFNALSYVPTECAINFSSCKIFSLYVTWFRWPLHNKITILSFPKCGPLWDVHSNFSSKSHWKTIVSEFVDFTAKICYLNCSDSNTVTPCNIKTQFSHIKQVFHI